MEPMTRGGTRNRGEGLARHAPSGSAEITPHSLPSEERWHWVAPAVIVLAILATFAPICGHDFTNWDDNINVTHNPHLNPPTAASLLFFWEHPYQKLYIPLAYTAWWLLARVARVDAPDVHGIRLNPYIFHAANLLLHVGVCLVVFRLLELLTRRRWAACAGALLFALHPLQVEPVAWVTGLKDLSCGLLSMVALWQYVMFAGEAAAHTPSGKAIGKSSRYLHYVAATLAVVGAMLCKPSAVTVPLIAAALDGLILHRRWRQVVIALIPWLAISVAFTAISIFVQPDVAGSPSPLWTRPLIAADALAFYLGKLFAPIRLAAIYPHSEQQVLNGPLVYVTWLAPAAIGLLAWRFRKAAPWAAAGAVIFLAALLPVLGLAPFEYENISTVADRYVYVAMLGPSLAIAGMLSWLHSRASRQMVRYLAAGCVCGIATLAVLSARQARYWQDSRTLFARVLALDPRGDVADCDLAADALANGRPDEAERYARRATDLFPGRPNNGITLGIALQSLGRHAEAAAEFLKVSQAHPDNVIALTYLASELARSGHDAQAMALCRAAIQVGPNFPDAHRLMATLLSAQHKFAEALPEAAEAVRLDPSVAANHLTYGKLLAATGHPNEAEEQFAAARDIDPEGHDAAGDGSTRP